MRLCFAKTLAKEPHELAAARWRNPAPMIERCGGALGGEIRVTGRHVTDRFPVDRRITDEPPGLRFNAGKLEDMAGFFSGRHAKNSFAFAIAAMPASMVSSFFPKQRRTRCVMLCFSEKADRGITATPARLTAASANRSSSTAISEALRSTQRK